jgi:hypothetical protein
VTHASVWRGLLRPRRRSSAAIREIADRVDGKVPAAVTGPGDDGKLVIEIRQFAEPEDSDAIIAA